MNLNEFLERQGEIYERFENNEKSVREKGILLDPALEKEVGAHNIVALYSAEALQKVEKLSGRIAETVPAILYGPANAHVSIMALTSDFFCEPDQDIMTKLAQAVELSLQTTPVGPFGIDFIQPLFNQACVMLEGVPQEDSFLRISQAIVESCKKLDLPVKLPWGCHSTISRFTEAQPSEKLPGFFRLMEKVREKKPFARAQVEAIGIGYCTASIREGFKLYIEKTFKLKGD